MALERGGEVLEGVGLGGKKRSSELSNFQNLRMSSKFEIKAKPFWTRKEKRMMLEECKDEGEDTENERKWLYAPSRIVIER